MEHEVGIAHILHFLTLFILEALLHRAPRSRKAVLARVWDEKDVSPRDGPRASTPARGATDQGVHLV